MQARGAWNKDIDDTLVEPWKMPTPEIFQQTLNKRDKEYKSWGLKG